MVDRRHPFWLLRVELRPAVACDLAELDQVIAALSADHAEFLAVRDRDSGAIHMGACDERQLEVNVARLRAKAPGGFDVGPPEVAYRESIGQAAEVSFKGMKTPVDGKRFACIKLAVSPLDVRFDYQFENKAAESAVPKALVPAVERGIQALLEGGVCWGFPMIGLKISLLDADHEFGSLTELTLEFAARAAFRKAFLKADPHVLEPVSKVVVVTPDETMGALMADLTGRRGQILDTVSQEGQTTLEAFVPTAMLFGYSNTLRAMTQWHGSFSTAFSHYQRVPDTKGDGPPWSEPTSAALRP